MVRIGWLHDDFGITGGAEITRDILMDTAPPDVENVRCPPEKRPPDVDLFVIGNCILYHERWLEELVKKPVVKHVHDLWPYGSPILRRWLLDNAALLLFNSPKQLSLFKFPFAAPHDFLPPPVDVKKFQEAAERANHRKGMVWFGRLGVNKGIQHVMDYALRTGTKIDLYGPCYDSMVKVVPPCVYKGIALREELPEILARYKKFIHMPVKEDVCGRAAVEAWAAGLELFFGGNADEQAFWDWLDPEACQNAAATFWGKALEVL